MSEKETWLQPFENSGEARAYIAELYESISQLQKFSLITSSIECLKWILGKKEFMALPATWFVALGVESLHKAVELLDETDWGSLKDETKLITSYLQARRDAYVRQAGADLKIEVPVDIDLGSDLPHSHWRTLLVHEMDATLDLMRARSQSTELTSITPLVVDE